MKNLFRTMMMAGFLAAGCGASQAQTVDMATLTCRDALGMNSADLASVLIWMHGYFGGEAHDTVLDFKGLGDSSGVLGNYCSKNPNVAVMTAIKKLF